MVDQARKLARHLAADLRMVSCAEQHGAQAAFGGQGGRQALEAGS